MSELAEMVIASSVFCFFTGCIAGYNLKKETIMNLGRLRTVSAHSTRAIFTNRALRVPIARSPYRCVGKGSYSNTQSMPCVCKWFRPGVDSIIESTYYERDLRAIARARDLIQEWNNLCLMSEVEVLKPEVCSLSKDQAVVTIEPYIEEFSKFNSNTGWADSSTHTGELMQALSHFSYHATDGQALICDLQGGYELENLGEKLLLSGPVIHSSNGEYGTGDFGFIGMCDFFRHHKCNRYCKRKWRQLEVNGSYNRPQKGTKLMKNPFRN